MRKNFTLCLITASLLSLQSALAADFTVTSTADSGPGTLRQALIDAAASPGTDNILFNISSSPAMITLNSALTISTPVVIDGYSQPGALAGPINARQLVIGLNFNGFNLSAAAYDGVIITTGNVTIKGLAIYRAQRGIVLNGTAGTGGAVRIQGCSIGLTEANQTAIEDPDTGNFLGVRNSGNGVHFLQTNTGFAIPRVYLGTDGDGVNDASEGNLISNNAGDGVFLNVADYNVIAGNFIGTTATGATPTFAASNTNGITLNGNNTGDGSSNNRIGTNGDGVSDALEGNLISANRMNGIVMQSRGSFNTVAGNTIGVSLTGGTAANGRVGTTTPAFPTQGNGILLSNVTNNTIGVTPGTGVAAQRNYVGSNFFNGIAVLASSGFVTGNNIMGNAIGVNSSNIARGNLGFGVYVASTAVGALNFQNLIGSDDDGNGDAIEGNIVANNQRDGVGLLETSAGTVFNNRISRNSIYNNALIGINLMLTPTEGTTPNSPAGVGPNFAFNYPVTTSFGVNATDQKIEVTGTAPSGSYIQYYIASSDANPDAPGYNEGRTFLFGATEGGLLDEDFGDGTFKFTLNFADLASTITAGQSVVALAHDIETGVANTSEFSATAVSVVLLPVTFVNFQANLQNDKVLVSWSTSFEQNASHFDVERSTNGADFTKIGTVKAKGNSSTLTNYSFTDANPVPGVSYYRLRQVDLDNRFVYTKTVVVRNQSAGRAFSVWPNPVLDNVNVTLLSDKNQNLNIRVVDFNGRIVRTQMVNATKGTNQITVNMSSLTRGTYVVQVVGENLNLNEKVIKQ